MKEVLFGRFRLTVNFKKSRMVLTILFLLAGHYSAIAAEIGIIVLPRDISKLNVEDFISAVNEVKQAGSRVNLALIGGQELEPSPGKFAVKEKLGGYNYMAKILNSKTNYLGVSLINTTRRDISADLIKTPWTNPKMLKRFSKLLDKIQMHLDVIPTQFLIGNEVDVYFESHPNELSPFLEFFKRARLLILEKYPTAQVGMSVTFEGLKKNRAKMIRQIIEASDAAFFTYYPLGVNEQSNPDYQQDINEIVKTAGAKQVFLQEVGYSTLPLLVTSAQKQDEFFKLILPVIQQEPQITMAAIFAQHDIDPPMCQTLIKYYGFSRASGEFKSLFRDMICSLGLKTFDGSAKPAWNTVSRFLQN